MDGAGGREWSARVVTNTVDRALRRLRTDCLDVMLLHSCPLSVLQKGDALDAMVRARDQGKIRFAGYSGDNDAAAYAAGLPDVAVVQTSVNICDQSNIDSVLPRTREGGQGVLAKRPLANAAWKDVSVQRGIYQNYSRSYMARLQSMGFTLTDLGFEGDPARVWPGIALRFTLSQPGVHCAIAGTTSIRNARANLQAAGPWSAPAFGRPKNSPGLSLCTVPVRGGLAGLDLILMTFQAADYGPILAPLLDPGRLSGTGARPFRPQNSGFAGCGDAGQGVCPRESRGPGNGPGLFGRSLAPP